MTTRNTSMRRNSFCVTVIFFSLVFFLGIFSSLGLAQVVTNITPSGLGTVVASPNGTVTDITGGTRPEITPGVPGPNLFHSFEHFSIGRNEVTGVNDVANFLNDTGLPTQNVLSRVTGGDPSQIFGTIQTTNFGLANLFLMNHAGVVFGPTASLDVRGSFHVTTADYIRLTDNVQFTAVPSPSDTLLSVAPVAAFGFLSDNPAGITYDGSSQARDELNIPKSDVLSLAVAEGQTLSLVGGDIRITGNFDPTLSNFDNTEVSASGGQVNIISITSEGEALLDPAESSTIFTVDTLPELGDVQLTKGVLITIEGSGGGAVSIQSGRLSIQESTILSTTGHIVLKAKESLNISDQSFVQSRPEEEGEGVVSIRGGRLSIQESTILSTAGPIVLKAKESLNISDQSLVRTRTEGEGERAAGNIELGVDGGQLAIMSGSRVTTQSSRGARAPGNIDVTVEGGDVLIDFSAILSRFSTPMEESEITGQTQSRADNDSPMTENRTAGQIHVRADNLELTNISIIQATNFSPQKIGGVSIDLTGNLQVREQAQILAISRSEADATDLNITAKDIVIAGNNNVPAGDGSLISTDAQSDGRGGNLNIMAENLRVTEQGSITSRARTPQGSIILGLPTATGDAGNIDIELSGNLVVTRGGNILADTENTGTGGNINVKAGEVSLSEGASVSTESTSTGDNAGDAGDIDLTADRAIRINNSTVTTRAENALGGNIKLKAEDLIQITNSELTSRVREGSESAGKIDIDPDFVVIQNSDILSTAFSGEGGPITIIANSTVLVDPFSNLDASSQFGGSGTIDIQAPIQQLSGTIAPLPENIVKLVSLYAERCASQKDGQFSSFGKSMDSAPPPGEFLTSPLTFSEPGIPQLTTQASVLRIAGITDSRRLEELFEAMTWKISEHNLSTSSLQTCALQME